MTTVCHFCCHLDASQHWLTPTRSTNWCSVPVKQADIVRQVTSGSKRRVCWHSRHHRCLRTLQHTSTMNESTVGWHESTSQPPFWRKDLQFTPNQPCQRPNRLQMGTILTILAHWIHNNSFWGVVNENNPLTRPFYSSIWLDPSTSNLLCPIFCQTDPLPDPCCRSITTLAINLLRGDWSIYTYRFFGSMVINASEMFWFCCSPMTDYNNYASLRMFQLEVGSTWHLSSVSLANYKTSLYRYVRLIILYSCIQLHLGVV